MLLLAIDVPRSILRHLLRPPYELLSLFVPSQMRVGRAIVLIIAILVDVFIAHSDLVTLGLPGYSEIMSDEVFLELGSLVPVLVLPYTEVPLECFKS